MHAVGTPIFLPDGRVLVERRRTLSHLIRFVLRKETDLTELVSGLGAVLWAAFAAREDVLPYLALPGVALVPPSALTILLQLLLALGGLLQLLAVGQELHRLRRFCALCSAASWGALGLLTAATGPHSPSALLFVLAASQSLAYVKMGQPARRAA